MNKERQGYLPGGRPRGRRMRLDTASILKRLFFCEEALIVSQAGWLLPIAPFDIKASLPRLIWEDAMTANALRERVFELHYPNRLMTIGEDAALIEVLQAAADAPSIEAYIGALARVFKPALLRVYRNYLAEADSIADGPTLRFMRIAFQEKEAQVITLERFTEKMLADAPDRRSEAESWIAAIADRLVQIGGISLDSIVPSGQEMSLPGRRSFQRPDAAVRDKSFHQCRFYWPDIIDPGFPYGEGISLQLRSAISHINEVWAIDAAATSLNAFAKTLGWEFIYAAARWTYDEARHSAMGYDRLRQWGFENRDIPMGTYIYDSVRGKPPIYLLGMLSYFEAKNIGKKKQRAKVFAGYNDRVSQHDMDFDWADETIHAHYGAHWLSVLRKVRPEDVPDADTLHTECNRLVNATIAEATDQERADIRQVAQAMTTRAEALVQSEK